MFKPRCLAPIVILISACADARGVGSSAAGAPGQDEFAADRQGMVTEQIAARDVRDPRVLAAMRDVPRHLFVPPELQRQAYQDRPLPIGYDQTISQPYIVALMTELARPRAGDRALEVGTGSGYQAAVLSRLVSHVYTIEIVEPLARSAEQRLKALGYVNVTVRTGDGYAGWPDNAPFDIILVTAAPDHVPAPLLTQLKPGGRLVVPIGPVSAVQELQLIEKDNAGRTSTTRVAPVQFVPLVRPR
ncbi:MAG TPA: protein-L-isoaspartate(D-aspartate) O-methyltransferase [Vicinamibacterales bacterium]|jgi:protein-L-isoaspartate(D-aspartate) O-methyltransferase